MDSKKSFGKSNPFIEDSAERSKRTTMDVAQRMLKKNEMTSKENDKGFEAIKGKDNRDELMLSTKQANQTANIYRQVGAI